MFNNLTKHFIKIITIFFFFWHTTYEYDHKIHNLY